MLCARKPKAINDTTYSGWKLSCGFEEFEEEGLYFKNARAVKVPEKVMGYRVECEKDGNRNYVDGTVMHIARLDEWIGCAVKTMDTEIKPSGQRQTLFSTLYGRCPYHLVAGILKVAWKAVKNVHAAKFDTDHVKDEKKERRVGTQREQGL